MSKVSLDNKRVLIVDDEPDVLESLEELLDMCTTVWALTVVHMSRSSSRDSRTSGSSSTISTLLLSKLTLDIFPSYDFSGYSVSFRMTNFPTRASSSCV